MQTRPLNTFPVGTIVDIPFTIYKKVKIIAINESGVSMTCSEYTGVLSGVSPSILHEPSAEEIAQNTPKTDDNAPASAPGKRGRKKAEISTKIGVPSEEFTIKELCEFNDVQRNDVLPFIKEYCVVCGQEKVEGQRGKPSNIYKLV